MADPSTLPSVFLRRVDGSFAEFSNAECEQILAHLTAAGAASTAAQETSNGSQIFFWAASPYLVLADLAWSVGRRMSELFIVAVDRSQPFSLRFQSDDAYYSLQDALAMSGWSGEDPETLDDLKKVYMTVYESEFSIDAYCVNTYDGDEEAVQLVRYGGGGLRPAEIRQLRAGRDLTVAMDRSTITFHLERPLDAFLQLDDWYAATYTTDADVEGVSLALQHGVGSEPSVFRRLMGAGGLKIEAEEGLLRLTAPIPPPPYRLEDVSTGMSLLSLSSSVDVGRLRGLLSAGGIVLTINQDDERDVIVGLAPTITAVTKIAPPRGLLSVAALLRVEAEQPTLSFADVEGNELWRVEAGAEILSVSKVGSAAVLELGEQARVAGLIVTALSELRASDNRPLRFQSPSGATALTVLTGGSCDLVLNSLLSPLNGAPLMQVVGGKLAMADVQANAVSTGALTLSGSTTRLSFQINRSDAWELAAQGDGGLHISRYADATWQWALRLRADGSLQFSGDINSFGGATFQGEIRASAFKLRNGSVAIQSVEAKTVPPAEYQFDVEESTGNWQLLLFRTPSTPARPILEATPAGNLATSGTITASDFLVGSTSVTTLLNGSVADARSSATAAAASASLASTKALEAGAFAGFANDSKNLAIGAADRANGAADRASSSATAAGSSATTAASSATAAASSASNAASSATAAASSATNASSAATSAASSATAAATSAAQALSGRVALPFFADDVAALAAGMPRFSLYRYGDGLSFRMLVKSAVPEFFYAPVASSLTVAGVNLNQTGQWTLEFWARVTQPQTANVLCQLSQTSPNLTWTVGLRSDGLMTVSTNSGYANTGGTTLYAADGWAHFAFVCNGTSMDVFKNGQFAIQLVPGVLLFQNTTWRVCSSQDTTGQLHLSNLQLTNSRRYTLDFDPAFPLSGGTALIRGSPPGVVPSIFGFSTAGGNLGVSTMPSLGSYVS